MMWRRRQNSKMQKSSCILVKKASLLQMAKNLPRGTTRSLVTVSPFHQHGHQACYSLTKPSTTSLILFSSFNALYSQFNMDKTPQVISGSNEEEGVMKKDEVSKSKLVSDYILPHILNLYSRATAKDFEIYAPNATFEDPLMCAHGVKQIKSAFYSLAKVFSESRIVDYSITENETSPGKLEILIDNKQYYKFLGKDINMISLIKLHTENGKVVRHEDRWDKKPLWDRETVKMPLVGHVIEATRRASMLATHALMSFGKDPST